MIPGARVARRRARLRTVPGIVAAGVGAVVVLVATTWLLIVVRRALPDDALGQSRSPTAPAFAERDVRDTAQAGVLIPDTLLGRSQALRFAALTASEALEMPGIARSLGDSAGPGPATLALDLGSASFTVFVVRPFAHKRGEMLGPYRLGWWPAERWMMAANYLNPDGFVEVQRGADSTRLSSHFSMRDFLMQDQEDTWPKYVVLEERLLDKLELILRELGERGVAANRAVVLSGFRAPYYNDRRVDEGAVRSSRHQFGDAADVIIDADGDGRMDDLNGDRRHDLRDIAVIGSAVSAVEREYPELSGGLGSYAAQGPSGPFAHIDVRGTSARWERARSARGDSSAR